MPKSSSLRVRALQSRDAIELLSNKWRVTVLHLLTLTAVRPSDLLRAMPDVSGKMLTQTLHGMERDGLIERRQRVGHRGHVQYALTPMGVDVIPLLKALCHWAEDHAVVRDEARAHYDRRRRRS